MRQIVGFSHMNQEPSDRFPPTSVLGDTALLSMNVLFICSYGENPCGGLDSDKNG